MSDFCGHVLPLLMIVTNNVILLVTCIEFNHTKYSEVESVALLSVTLQLTGRLQLFPVDVIIIVSESTTGFTKGNINLYLHTIHFLMSLC